MPNLPAGLPPSHARHEPSHAGDRQRADAQRGPADAAPLIERLPGPESGEDALGAFVARGTRPWGGEPVAVPGPVLVALWVLLAATTGFGTWLTTVVFAGTPCPGVPCTITTWGHPGLVLTLAGACALPLGALAVRFHGLVELTPAALAAALVAAACGVVAVAGVAALLLGVVGGAALVAALLVAVAERI